MRILLCIMLCFTLSSPLAIGNNLDNSFNLEELSNIDSLQQQLSISTNPVQKSQILFEIARDFIRAGQGDSVLHYGKLAVQQFKPGNESKTLIKARMVEGVGYWKTGDYKTAMEIFQSCKTISEKRNYKKNLYNAISNIAMMNAEQGNYDEAIAIWKKQCEQHGEDIDPATIASKYNNIGLAIQFKGNYEEAGKNFFKGLAIAEDIKDTLLQIRFHNNLGLVYKEFGDTIKALQLFEKSQDLAVEFGNKEFESLAQINLGVTFQDLKQYEKSLQYFESALKIKKSIGEKMGIANVLGNIAYTQFYRKIYNKAQEALDASMHLVTEMDSKIRIIILERLQANIYSEQGKFDEAIEILKAVKEKSIAINSNVELRNTLLDLAKCYSKNNEYEKAQNELLAYSKIEDNINSNNKSTAISSIEDQYELEKTKRIIAENEAMTEKDLADKKFWQMLATMSFLAILLLGYALRNRFKLMQLIKEDNNALQSQNSQLINESSELKQSNESLEAELLSINEKLKEPNLLKEGTITLSNRQKTVLKLGDIIYIKASQNGVQIVTTNEKFIYWKGIGKFALDLPPSLFVQTHRSYIVNKIHVKSIQSEQLKMSNNDLVRIGGDYKQKTVTIIKGD